MTPEMLSKMLYAVKEGLIKKKQKEDLHSNQHLELVIYMERDLWTNMMITANKAPAPYTANFLLDQGKSLDGYPIFRVTSNIGEKHPLIRIVEVKPADFIEIADDQDYNFGEANLTADLFSIKNEFIKINVKGGEI